MSWPWVSRGRLEDAERRFAAADAERLRLLDLLLGNAPATAGQVRAVPRLVSQEEPETASAAASVPHGEPAAYTTPFDSVVQRFDRAHRNGRIPPEFKARLR